jgi:hypothetical protein
MLRELMTVIFGIFLIIRRQIELVTIAFVTLSLLVSKINIKYLTNFKILIDFNQRV